MGLKVGDKFMRQQIGMEGPWTVERFIADQATLRSTGANWTTTRPVWELRPIYDWTPWNG